MEWQRRKVINAETLETANAGCANGISTQLKAVLDSGEHRSLHDTEKWKIIDEATGLVVFDPVMPTTAPRLGTLILTAPSADKVYKIVLNRATSSKGSWITLGFVDYQP